MEMQPDDVLKIPKYRCHKEVRALKIRYVDQAERVLVPEDIVFPPFKVTAEYMEKHKPFAGGYFVTYEDGYSSFSPADAFESGYTMLSDHLSTLG